MIGSADSAFLNRVTPGPDGKFTYTAVPPGQYTLNARANRPAGGAGAGGGQPAVAANGWSSRLRVAAGGGGAGAINPDEIMAAMGVAAAAGPASGAWPTSPSTAHPSRTSSISMQPAMTLSGRGRVQDRRAARRSRTSRACASRVVPAPTAGGVTIMMGGSRRSQIDPAGKFTVTGVTPGRYRLTGNAPVAPGTGPGITWTLRSAMVKGRDVLDFPLDIGPGEEIGDAVLTFTDATQQVTGVLQDATGRPAPDYTIVVFAGRQGVLDAAVAADPDRPARHRRPVHRRQPAAGRLPHRGAGGHRAGRGERPGVPGAAAPGVVSIHAGRGRKKVQDLRIAGGAV